jgi:trimeric autotransporter adhesin
MGELPTVGQLPAQGTAIYDGHTVGSAALLQGGVWRTYIATGDVHMDWDFGQRAGLLEINNFVDPVGPDEQHQLPTLNVSGTMSMPGQLNEINKFSGPLLGTLGDHCPVNISGGAIGSFAANGADKTAGVIGNWNAANNNYRAAGIFGASRAVDD